MLACKRNQLDPYVSRYTKIKSKWTKGFNIKLDILNLKEKRVKNSLECIGTRNNFLNRRSPSQELRSIIINRTS